jgi:hypothetical protein
MPKVAKHMLKARTPTKMEASETGSLTVEALPSTASTMEGYDAEFWPGRRLVLSRFNGQLLVHIREYKTVEDKIYPTKKGACFTSSRLRALRERIEFIDAILSQLEVNESYNVTVGGGGDDPLFKEHLGGGIYVTIHEKYRGVNLRRYWMPPAQNISIVPTKNGIFIPALQWGKLKVKLDELLAAYPELMDAPICNDTHGGNQMEFFECRECTPFGYSCTN